MLEFLLISNSFSINTAEVMAKSKARSPHTRVSSCFRHCKHQGERTLAIPLEATPVCHFLSGGFPSGYSAKCRCQPNLTHQCYNLHGEQPAVVSLLKRFLPNYKKSKQPKVLTNRVTESLPIDIVHCKQTSNNGTGFFFLV